MSQEPVSDHLAFDVSWLQDSVKEPKKIKNKKLRLCPYFLRTNSLNKFQEMAVGYSNLRSKA